MASAYCFALDIDIFHSVPYHVINGTDVSIINSGIVNSSVGFLILILNIYRIIIGVAELEQEIDLPLRARVREKDGEE